MQNMYPIAGCARRLEAAGFDNVRIDDLTEEVFPGHLRCMRRRLRSPEIVRRFSPFWYAYWWLAVELPEGWPDYKYWREYQYILASAEKPDLFPDGLKNKRPKKKTAGGAK